MSKKTPVGYLLPFLAVVVLAAVGFSGCLRADTYDVSVTVIDDAPTGNYTEGYEAIPGVPASVGVYVYHADMTPPSRWEHVDDISLAAASDEPGVFEGEKTITWDGDGMLCVGYQPSCLCCGPDGVSVVSVKFREQAVGGSQPAIAPPVHHWKRSPCLP